MKIAFVTLLVFVLSGTGLSQSPIEGSVTTSESISDETITTLTDSPDSSSVEDDLSAIVTPAPVQDVTETLPPGSIDITTTPSPAFGETVAPTSEDVYSLTNSTSAAPRSVGSSTWTYGFAMVVGLLGAGLGGIFARGL